MRVIIIIGTAVLAAAAPCPAALIGPQDLEYRGAFRLPDWPVYEEGWYWSGEALTHYPGGDPGGGADGYPGSLFGTGHAFTQYVSEIGIPAPVISPSKNLADLPVAPTLQGFRDIRGGVIPFSSYEMPRAGLEYLPAQGAQASGRLYFCWAQHLDEMNSGPSHGWCGLDLADPRTAGAWRIGGYRHYVTADYLFSIPPSWAAAHASGMSLATGRYRDGGQGAQGPSIFAIAPWKEGNPPPAGATLPALPLLLYDDVVSGTHTMAGYHHSDEWSGAAWLTAGESAAVVFAGTKGIGDCWYGNPDGPCLDCDNRGWWSTGFVGEFIFYDPDDLAAVARGEMPSWGPQPYAVMGVDDVLYHVVSPQEWYHLGAAAFDRENGFLYVMEPNADDDKPVVHVWKVHPGTGAPAGGSLSIEPGTLRGGKPFGFSIAFTGAISTAFDFYVVAETDSGAYTLPFDGNVLPGIGPLYTGVPGYLGPFGRAVTGMVAVPEWMRGRTVAFYAAAIEAGTLPPVSRLSDLTASTPHVILMDRAAVKVE